MNPNSQDPVVIAGQARTPMGAFLGELSPLGATDLGARAITGALECAGVPAADVDEVIMGCVLTAGVGQAPARQASIKAGIPDATGCTTVNKVCGSGMKAIMLAHDLLLAGSNRVMVAGGMESMSNAPHLLRESRKGYRFGHGKLVDHMAFDGLEDAYEGNSMGVYAEMCADRYQLTRQAQDDYALASLRRARTAIDEGAFSSEIVPVVVPSRDCERKIDTDEQPLKAQFDKIPLLRPSFRPNGTVTPANASSISDGAAALVLMRRSEALRRGLKPRARIVAHASHANSPPRFTTAPTGAIDALMHRTGWSKEQVDLYEINEAFAVVPMVVMEQCGLDHARVNVHGGACALGHPIGCSGARIVITLLAALERHGGRRGVATICIGGGEATALALESC